MLVKLEAVSEERDRLFYKFSLFAWIGSVCYVILHYRMGAWSAFYTQLIGATLLAPLSITLYKYSFKQTARILTYLNYSICLYIGGQVYGIGTHSENWHYALVISAFLVCDPSERKKIFSCVSVMVFFWALNLFGPKILPESSMVEPNLLIQLSGNYLGSMVICLAFLSIFIRIMGRERQELEQSRAQLIHASKLSSLGEMASGVAHEINNPLAIISLANQSMKKLYERGGEDRAKMLKGLNDIDLTVQRISKIVHGLKNVSRHDSGRGMVQTPIRAILEDVLGLCSEKFKNHGISMTVNDPENVQAEQIKCHPVQISQVLINLLNNAYDAVHDIKDGQRWIRLDLSREEEAIFIRVSDSGPGISKDMKERVFEPFFTTKDPGKGTGIGLSIGKNIMEAHGGMLYLDPNLAQTCFVLKLVT